MMCLPIGVEQWVNALTSQAAITFIVGAAAVAVSIITYVYQRKQLKLNSLMEVFKVLNLPDHREARKVTYGEKTHASYDILKITRPEVDGTLLGEIERVSTDIVKGDMNNAATLIYHGLMDESIFLEEYWWIVLRCWDSVKDTVIQRRSSGTGALSYMRNLEKLTSKAEEYAKEHSKKDYEEYERKYRSEYRKQ
jgi:hypothetical protein